MACKWLTVFLSDLDHDATRFKQNILYIESEVMDSDDSTIKIIFNLSCYDFPKMLYVLKIDFVFRMANCIY